ncbi:MAG TPA: type II secretion system ATPase GspE [Nitrospinota bacterium]|nr:type II secretion system ATPase GspE [Nitrospinota bacterium]
MNNKIESLEQILLKEKMISEKTLRELQTKKISGGNHIGKYLVDMGYIHEEDLTKAISKQLNIDCLKKKDYPESPVPIEDLNIPLNYLIEHKCLPVKLDKDKLTIAMVDPLDFYTIDNLKLTLGFNVEVCLSPEKDIIETLEHWYGSGASVMEQIVGRMGEEELELLSSTDSDDVEHLKDMASEAPVIKLVNIIISRAVEIEASDIHFEPFENDLRIRYRIDGVLHDMEAPTKRLQNAITSRIKIMAKLNIAERRLPQDGRIKHRLLGKEIDMRVSTIPTVYGESVVLRILDRGNVVLDLEKLGFPGDPLKQFESIISKPYGMLLVTGPTGSGKTTTLYASLNKLNSSEKKIITIEDPIEYQLHGVNQIHVKPQIGLTFSSGLRSIVRQDPDIIMVGEIRDAETADIAIQAALTGHMVFSTVHTNDSAGAITRLSDMGIEHYLMASALVGVLAQRLVRKICSHCKKLAKVNEKSLEEMGSEIRDILDVNNLYEGEGCEKCNRTGYRGRVGIYELLLIREEIHDMILNKTSSVHIKEKARLLGMTTLRGDGWQKVKDGVTSLSEIYRVTLEEEI